MNTLRIVNLWLHICYIFRQIILLNNHMISSPSMETLWWLHFSYIEGETHRLYEKLIAAFKPEYTLTSWLFGNWSLNSNIWEVNSIIQSFIFPPELVQPSDLDEI